MKTYFLRPIIVPVERQGRVKLPYVSFHIGARSITSRRVSFWARKKSMQLVVCRVRRPVQLECSKKDLSQYEPRGQSFQSARCTAKGPLKIWTGAESPQWQTTMWR